MKADGVVSGTQFLPDEGEKLRHRPGSPSHSRPPTWQVEIRGRPGGRLNKRIREEAMSADGTTLVTTSPQSSPHVTIRFEGHSSRLNRSVRDPSGSGSTRSMAWVLRVWKRLGGYLFVLLSLSSSSASEPRIQAKHSQAVGLSAGPRVKPEDDDRESVSTPTAQYAGKPLACHCDRGIALPTLKVKSSTLSASASTVQRKFKSYQTPPARKAALGTASTAPPGSV